MLQSSRVSELEHEHTNTHETPPTFDEVCTPFRDEMVSYAYRLTRDKARAEDIVHDAMLKAFMAWPRWAPANKYDGDVNNAARAWLYRCVSNTFNKAYKREKHWGRIVATALEPEPVSTQPTITEQDDLTDEVRIALVSLLPYQREVIELIYIEGLSHAEVAHTLEISVGTVYSRLNRARTMLQKSLGTYSRKNYGIGTFEGDDCELAEMALAMTENRTAALVMLHEECGWTLGKAKCVLEMLARR